jgi:flagella basal body P-ring formation protein FlgA
MPRPVASLPASILAALLAAGIGVSAVAEEPLSGAGGSITGASFAGLVEQAAGDAVRARIAPPDRFDVLACRMDGGSLPPAGPVRVETLDVEGPNASGVARVRLRILAGGKPAGEARLTVRGEVRGPALIARATLRRGIPIPADAVEVAESVLTRLTDPPLRAADEVRGLVPVRTLAAGQVLTSALVGGAAVVRRGQPVSLRIESDHLSVVARGVARRDGAIGDTVPAENTATGVLVVGRVQPDGSLLVRSGESRRKRS